MTSNVHEAIIQVMGKVGYVQKEKVGGLPYTFAGERALIKALRPAMLENDIYLHVSDIEMIQRNEYTSRNGAAMTNILLHGVVRFTHAPSETFIDVHATGEGADAGDKAANKAATGLLKYALRQTFLIETGDDPDATGSDELARAVEFATGQDGKSDPRPKPKKAPKPDKPSGESTKNKPTKVGEDAVSVFWSTANHLIEQEVLTKEQAQEYVMDNKSDFVAALDELTLQHIPPEDDNE